MFKIADLINKVYPCEASSFMLLMPANCIDLTVTSPPYDNLRNYKGYVFNFEAIANELFRVTKNGGVVVWVVGDATIKGSETGTSFRQALYFKQIGFNLHDTMIYQKDNPPPIGGNNRYYQHFEYMFVFSKGVPKIFNPITTKRRNKWNDNRTERVKGFTRNKDGNFTKKKVSLIGDVKIGNIFKYVVGGGASASNLIAHQHPAIFPEQLVHDHIISWSNKGDIVFDPMCGSGTTLNEAKKLKRNYIGIDISVEYQQLSLQRLSS